MTWLQVLSAVAETTKQTAPTVSGVAGEGWWGPTLVGAIGGAIIAVLGMFLHSAYTRRKEQRQQQARRSKEQISDETRYLEWVTNQHRRLHLTGLRTRSPVDIELERVYVSLAADPRVLSAIESAPDDALAGALIPEDATRMRPLRHGEGTISMAEALRLVDGDRVSGLVILGGPGTGIRRRCSNIWPSLMPKGFKARVWTNPALGCHFLSPCIRLMPRLRSVHCPTISPCDARPRDAGSHRIFLKHNCVMVRVSSCWTV